MNDRDDCCLCNHQVTVGNLERQLAAVREWAERHYKDGRCNLCGAPRENHAEMSPACRVCRLDTILDGNESKNE